MNNPAKNNNKTQSTSFMTFEGFIFPRINMSEAPAKAISGIDKLRVWLKKNSIIIPRNIGTENFID